MKIYIDIGNTLTKISLDQEKTKCMFINTHDENLIDNLKNIIQANSISDVFFSSVVPNIYEELSSHLDGTKIFNIKDYLESFLTDKNISKQEVGSDLVALYHFAKSFSNNTIVVNLGTATSITHVLNGKFKGVVIMPGISKQVEAINKSASMINEKNLQFSSSHIGTTTNEAVNIGIINSQVFAIQKHIELIDKNAKVVISGGDSVYVKEFLEGTYIDEATIQGLKLWGKNVE